MLSHKDTFLSPEMPISDAIGILEQTVQKICLVVDVSERLLGTITDGDIRRGLLAAIPLDAPVTTIMNERPRIASPADDQGSILKILTELQIRHIPVVDADSRVIDLVTLDDLLHQPAVRENFVVLMAGGLGSRLLPLTDKVPKPLVSVGDKPILETILEGFVEQNFQNFYISVNYKADAIKKHFGDGEKWGVQILYLEEDRRLGTVGALQLLPKRPKEPLLIMNGDLLTRVNYQDLLSYHDEQESMATMCVRDYDFQVPFGVIDIENHQIKKIEEKPVFRFFVNAGIYVLAADTIDLIPKEEHFDMTHLFDRLIEAGHKTSAFPIHEYWHDVGHAGDLDKAIIDFEKHFNS